MIKVCNLIEIYKRELFGVLTIEFRNKDNYLIKKVSYGYFENYLKEENFKQEEVKEYFFGNNGELVILINKE